MLKYKRTICWIITTCNQTIRNPRGVYAYVYIAVNYKRYGRVSNCAYGEELIKAAYS